MQQFGRNLDDRYSKHCGFSWPPFCLWCDNKFSRCSVCSKWRSRHFLPNGAYHGFDNSSNQLKREHDILSLQFGHVPWMRSKETWLLAIACNHWKQKVHFKFSLSTVNHQELDVDEFLELINSTWRKHMVWKCFLHLSLLHISTGNEAGSVSSSSIAKQMQHSSSSTIASSSLTSSFSGGWGKSEIAKRIFKLSAIALSGSHFCF